MELRESPYFPKNKNMLFVKLKVARVKYLVGQAYKQAQRIAFAVVVMEFVLVGGYTVGEYKGIFDIFRGVTVQGEYINTAHAIVETRKPVETSQKPEINEIAKIADTIWMLESTRGINNYSKCEAAGKVNGIGYGIPGDGKYMCFESHKEEIYTLMSWIARKQAQGITGDNLFCLYNTGKATDTCKYSENAKFID